MSFKTIKTLFFLFCFCLVSCGFGMLFFLMQQPCVDFSVLEHYNPGTASRVLDCDGNEWMRFQQDRREPIPYQNISKHFIHAVIAAEDRRFFSHHGVSWRGIARSVFVNLYKRKIVQGASTITQQLVKLLFFSQERTFKRKIKEVFMTFIVERQFTKEQILETYSNHICFGMGIYGVQAAAKRFWNVDASNLTLAQAAMLAGIIPSPAHYNPLAHPEGALVRRNLILRLMLEQKYITQPEYEEAYKEPLVTAEIEKAGGAHAREMVRQFLENLVGKDQLYCGGFTIKTTFNRTLQKVAEDVFTEHVRNFCETQGEKTGEKNCIDGGLITLDSQCGAIRALVGGYDFSVSPFNRATQAQRQMGSIVKPWIYELAVLQGKSLGDLEYDEPFELQGWNPRNFNRRHEGVMTLARALAVSNNIIAIKLLLQVGIPNLIDLLRKVHLPGPFMPYPSLALGCTECSLLQATAAFNVFVHKGTYVKPYCIEWVKDSLGKKIWKHTPVSEPVLDWSSSSQIVRVLKLVPKKLQSKIAGAWTPHESMGKTGTTNDARTCWYLGSTADGYTTGVFLGSDDNRSLAGRLYATRHVVPIWRDFHTKVAEKLPHESRKVFYHDPSLRKKFINAKTGALIKAPADFRGECIEILVNS